MPLPTRTHSRKQKGGIALVHDTTYEAAYSAFRQALQRYIGSDHPCWVDAEDFNIDAHSGDDDGGQATGTAAYKTLSADGQRVGKKKDCNWSVSWRLVDANGLPRTVLSDYTITLT